MHHDILSTVEEEIIEKKIRVSYSTLTCSGCGYQEKIEGTIEMDTLINGWVSLSIDTLASGRVFNWLLCKDCDAKVRLAAGLNK